MCLRLKKNLKVLAVFLAMSSIIFAQNNKVEKLLTELQSASTDSAKIYLNKQLGYYYQNSNQEKAIEYFTQGLNMAKSAKDTLQIANILYSLGYTYGLRQEIPYALENYLKAIRYYEHLNDSWRSANTYMGIANLYMSDKDIENQMKYVKEAERVVLQSKDSIQLSNLYSFKGVLYDQRKMYDSALIYLNKSLKVAELINDSNSIASGLTNLGLTYKHIGKSQIALDYYDEALNIFKQEKNNFSLSILYNNIGSAYTQLGNYTESEKALKTSITYAEMVGAQQVILQDYKDLASLYSESQSYKKQSEFLEKYYNLKDSLFTIEKDNQVAQLESEYTIEKKDLEIEASQLKIEKKQKENTIYIILMCFGALVMVLLFFYFSRSRKKNQLLEQQNRLIRSQKEQLETTLSDLKSTQSQLIQSEKMASLGELTAGIAHEIQNPLNFVNNFSEVSAELLDEMTEELKNGDLEEVSAISEDIKQNLEKINHHGKRADSIVKGMLQHSRTGGDKKEVTDINKLADEYLRLSYHGLRAKDKSFNADFKTNFDTDLPKMKVIPQDIGRVILNLINNAFYACTERSKSVANGNEESSNKAYMPEVVVSTKKTPTSIEITVKDNGSGIPDPIKDKIFQPFFTTKPTGQGTGLGLSMSYDIITKGHGGELKVESKENVGTVFTIQLPKV